MKKFLDWWDLDIDKHFHDTHLNVAFDAWKAALIYIRGGDRKCKLDL